MAEMHQALSHNQDAIRLSEEAAKLFVDLNDEESANQARKIQTSVCVARGEIDKAPNRSDALLTLRHFISAVEERDEDKVKLFESELDAASGAISDEELNFALENLFAKDQSAVTFLEARG